MAFLFALSGCATTANTETQNLAWDAWQTCHHYAPGVAMDHIAPNGEIFVRFSGDRTTWANAGNREALVSCLRDEMSKKAK